MPYYVYIILCNDGSFYTGYSKNVKARVRLHANGRGARYTKMHKPQEVVYIEQLTSRAEAMRREKTIKNLNHQQKEDLIKSQKRANNQGEKPAERKFD